MKRTFLVLSILMVGLMSLSACSTTISNKRLREDILTLPSIYPITEVVDLIIIEKNQDSKHIDFQLKTTLNSYKCTITAEITMIYVMTDGKWVLQSNTVEVIKLIPKNDFVLSNTITNAIKDVSYKFFYNNIAEPKTKFTYSLLTLTTHDDEGSGTIIITQNYTGDYLLMDVQYTLTVTYNVAHGWNYELIDWVYNDTTKWEGTYNIHWTKVVLGYPMGSLNTFYTLNDDVTNIQITGDCHITRRMGQPDNDIIENTLQMSFDYKGVHYSDKPTLARMTNRIFFKLAAYPDSLAILEYLPLTNDPSNYYEVGVPGLDGVLTRVP